MKSYRIVLILAASLLVAALAFGAFQSAYAQGDDFDPFQCGNPIAPWFGNCPYTLEVCNPASGAFDPAPIWFDPAAHPEAAVIAPGVFGNSAASCGPGWDGMKEAGKCKLTGIDAEIYLGTPFEARWLGRGGYLRFIKPSGEFNYIAKVEVSSGTVMQDGNEYVGMFSARGVVEPGVYTVNCFGPGGTAGLGIKNVEIVGH